MPFYEYECENCKFYLETMQRISDAPLKKCPSCGKSTLKKLISAPNFRLKGAGWYETDFKSDKENKRNLAGAEKEESKPAESAASDSKPTESKAADSKPAAESKPTVRTTKRTPAKAPASKKAVKPVARPSRAKPKKAPARKAKRR